MPEKYYLAIFLLLVAGMMLVLNLKIRTSRFSKALTWFALWAAIIASVLVAFGVIQA